jgi:predicted dehydrogenase
LRINPERVTEDYTHCLLQFQSGAAGSIIVSANHRTQRQGLLKGRVLGQKGRIDFTIYPYSRALNAATLVLDGGKSIFVPDVRKETIKTPFPPSPSKVYPGFFDVYQKEIHAFLESIRNDTTPPITFEDGRAAIEVVLATYNSQAEITEHPNFENGLTKYRSDAASHPLLQQSTASKRES